MLDAICRRWWVHLVRGLAAICLGLCAMVWPGITLLVLVFLFAAFTIIDGVTSIILGIRGEQDGSVWWTMVLLGVLAITAGIIAFAWPALTLLVLLAIIAASAIVRGVLEIFAAIRLRKEIKGEWLLALSGVLSIIFGGLLIYRPDVGLVALALLFGAYMMVLGLLAVALSLRLRNICHSMALHGSPRDSAASEA
jgi:uncharacterized membrane protein HdeD (DUF308 family)